LLFCRMPLKAPPGGTDQAAGRRSSRAQVELGRYKITVAVCVDSAVYGESDMSDGGSSVRLVKNHA
jgi:hypothetical protein